MACQLLENDHATYAIDWWISYRVVRNHNGAVSCDNYARVITTPASRCCHSLSWSLAAVRSVEANWDCGHSVTTAGADNHVIHLDALAACKAPAMHLGQRRWVGKAVSSGSLKLPGAAVDRFFEVDMVSRIIERADAALAVSVCRAKGVERVASAPCPTPLLGSPSSRPT